MSPPQLSNLMSSDADEQLDRAIAAALAEPVPLEARRHLLGRAATWTAAKPTPARANWHIALALGAVAALLLLGVSIAAGLYSLDRLRFANGDGQDKTLADLQPADDEVSDLKELKELQKQTDAALRENPPAAPPSLAAKWISAIQVAIAERAPIIIANGGPQPLHLGAAVPQREAGGVLHVWDYSQSAASRVVADVELWTSHHVALSPDGTKLVWASGQIVELASGRQSHIDLGGADVRVGNATYNRIGDMQFSPDGGRLALHVTNMDEQVPGRIMNEVVQIVEFPSGKRLAEFPSGESYALRIGFSADGKQVVSGTPTRQVVLRDAGTGQVVRVLEPPLASQIMGIAISPDRSRIAASERAGDLWLWDSSSGKLMWHMSAAQLRELGGQSPGLGVLRFSPDAEHLAADSWGRVFVIETATGQVAAALRESVASEIHWSADGKTITVISAVAGSEGGRGLPRGRYDILPSVHEWDWKTGEQVRSLDASAAGNER